MSDNLSHDLNEALKAYRKTMRRMERTREVAAEAAAANDEAHANYVAVLNRVFPKVEGGR